MRAVMLIFVSLLCLIALEHFPNEASWFTNACKMLFIISIGAIIYSIVEGKKWL